MTGFAYDRWGAAVLYTLPAVVVAVPALALALADTLNCLRRVAAFQGVAAFVGGTLAGGRHSEHRTLLITLIAVAQVVSAVLLLVALRRRHD